MDLKQFVAEAKKYLWCDPSTRQALNRAGLHILPANYHSTVPSVDEIEGSFEYRGPTAPWLIESIFDDERLLGVLAELEPFAEEFDPPLECSEEPVQRYAWNSPAIGSCDAMAYYCFLRLRKPRRLIEVGAGYSTLIALEALERNGSGEIVCIDPYPKPFLELLQDRIEILRQPVQDVPLRFFEEGLLEGDVLFIDSSHTVKVGSDCLYLYLKVLPSLRAGVLVHSHDVFLPEALPRSFALDHHAYWTEQYLLLALLLGNPEWRVLFGSNYHCLYHGSEVERWMGGKVLAKGGSFWYEKVLRDPGRELE